MSWGHIICQKGGQVACPLRNKCGDRAAQSPYVTPRSLAYVTPRPLTYVMDNKPCGCTRPLAERGGGCRCFGSDHTPGVAPHGAFRSSTVLSTVAQWFVLVARETVDNDLQVRAALKCVTPYVLARVLFMVSYKVVL
jgi:hypothetical protein